MIDHLILTAANATQARGYTAQLRARQEAGLLKSFAHWRVIPDPKGQRVGSGGSTLWVLHQVARTLLNAKPKASSLAELFSGQRVVVIHSGGDSRRLACYAAQGKVFTPLPCEVGGAPAAMFDLIAANLAALPAPAAGQVLLAAGDVLLTFDPQALNFDRPGVVGVAYPGPLERGSQHGVYIADRDGTVCDFLQKPDPATAKARGAIDSVGRVLVDTGLVSLDPPAVQRWLAAAGVSLRRGRLAIRPGLLADVLAARTPPIDLYEQLLIAMPPRIDRATYLGAVMKKLASPAAQRQHEKRLTALHRALNRQPFHVNVLPYCDFFHIGTSRELLSNVNTLGRTATVYGFANFRHAVVAGRASLEGAFAYNSILRNPRTRTGPGVFLEAVHTDRTVELAGRNIVVGWPPSARTPLRLAEGWALVCLPLQGGDWSVALMGIEDDFKTPLASGGGFGNRPLTDFLARHRLQPATLWASDLPARQTLWEARLWSVGPIDRVLRQTLWMSSPHGRLPVGWAKTRRLSMEQLIRMVDHDRLIAHRTSIQRQVGMARLADRLTQEPWLPAARIVAQLASEADAGQALQQIDPLVKNDGTPLQQARVFKLAQAIREKFPRTQPGASLRAAGDLHQATASAIARAVAQQLELPGKPRPAAILHDQAVWVTTPVRIDLSGGWSDTPPICTELGGTVVNAAITLNGQYPVQVMAKLREEPVIMLNSIDLGQSVRLSQTREIQRYQDPTDWAALPKAALVLAGLCPRDPNVPLRRWLDALGGGLDITLFSALPKGSGLGTSSVLGAAVLACLARVVGEKPTNEQLIARTSMLEQLMTTGGGWQDQVGGITPGVKLIRTRPGTDQTPSLHWTLFDRSSAGAFHQRLLLYYTGYRRLAKNILRNVVGRYLARDPEAIAIVHELKAAAEQMKVDLDSQNLEAVGHGIEKYWTLKKRLDPGSTNLKIESLLKPLNRDLIGRLLPGAGGGGFVFMVAKSEQSAQRIRRTLQDSPPNPLARFFDFDIDPQGLKVTVL